MSGSNNEIVYEGWLTKSPPSKRIWKARWRRRWFVLRHSGELPGQFFLQYYTDRNCRKLKGTIDLDQCEQVDVGLKFENSKQNYPHMFDVKTPKRIYYLAADSETDMNKWVDCVCQVCVEFNEESNESLLTPNDTGEPESPSLSPTSTVSGPYIPISECISGKPLNTPVGSSNGSNKVALKDLYQAQSVRQNKLNTIKQTVCDDDISNVIIINRKNILTNFPAKQEDSVNNGKITNIESAKKMAKHRNLENRPPDLKLSETMSPDVYDSPRKIVLDKSEWSPANWSSGVPVPNWDTFPNNSEISEEAYFSPGEIGSWSVVQRFGKLTIVDSKLPIVTNSLNRAIKQRAQPDTSSLRRPVAPPRPPKPSHLVVQENLHSYLNLDKSDTKASDTIKTSVPSQDENPIVDEMYDIPRSHQVHNEETTPGGRSSNRHNYLNAAPSEKGNVFIYDFAEVQSNNSQTETIPGEPTSPRSEGSGSGVVYSNLPSPLKTDISTPPAVNRELKPTRKTSESGVSNEPSPGGSFTGLIPKETSPGGPYTSGTSVELGVNGPPSIDRTLKPKKLPSDGAIKLSKPPEGNLSLRRVRAGPSPVPQQGSSSTLPNNLRNDRTRSEYSGSEDDHRKSPDNEPIYYFESSNNRYIPAGKKFTEIQYIDLDLDSDVNNTNTTNAAQTAEPTATVYKTVDFLKTEAFNRTRQEVEEERNKLPAE
ncbi:GRB2-associated-binding protein, putative [Pediculus humanus corporis]|uniref:GRB2-associated-binding protein, putative n=1 Tax=Pediculus humanus subsp. corporis TaxID=121224 RepID=E0V9D2_PEDHC|nr:GRB2-associated-binding protein, putative [Pediculus humanus corporis]EEB09988.1 GRB2-associated-binding protein, putative [Pediculus humanus corporis]